MPLLDHRGEPLQFATYKKKPDLPRTGDAFGQWAGRDSAFMTLPGGGVMQFDLNKLTLADFRSMRQHYQIGTSLNVLSFIMHQIDWRIEGGTAKVREFLTEQLDTNWTQVIRGISQAFWAGYGPSAVNYENTANGTQLWKIKDLVPEECKVNWKTHEGWAPPGKPKPKLYDYDGIAHLNAIIPPENTLWYPLLMENGDHYGRKLLKPAFPAWFFSNLMHLFANRYFERFGEPLPVGRAPFNDDVDVGDGVFVSGRRVMEQLVTNIRNRSVAVLPSDRDPTTKEFDYSIEYLESQMRGADFERYMSRLDEEMSLSVFTPILLFRTADVGSYNLGQAHLRIFQQMLNAIAGDMQYYIQHYIIDRLVDLNFARGGKDVRWVYRKQGQGDIGTYKELMTELVRQEKAMPDLEELGAITGLNWDKVKQLTADPALPADPATNPDGTPKDKSKVAKESKNILLEACQRAAREYGRGSKVPTLGYRNKFRAALEEDGFGPKEALEVTNKIYGGLLNWLPAGAEAAEDASDLLGMMTKIVDAEIRDVNATPS